MTNETKGVLNIIGAVIMFIIIVAAKMTHPDLDFKSFFSLTWWIGSAMALFMFFGLYHLNKK